MLASRQNNVAAMRSMGRDLESLHLDPTQQRDLQSELGQCVDRYRAAVDVSAVRRSKLEHIEAAVSGYRTKLDSFLLWLDATERSAVMTDVISADADTVQEQASQQRVSTFSNLPFYLFICLF